jgi:hypothetical protein
MVTPWGHIVLSKVRELIDHISETWDEELLRSLFWDVDVSRILEIPIASQGMEDFIAWNFTNNGLFTVKSAYHMEWEYRYCRRERRALGV